MKDINIYEFDLDLLKIDLIKNKPFKIHIMGERNTGKTLLIGNILNSISIRDIYLINYKPDYYGKYTNNNIKYYDDYYNEDNLKKYINDVSLVIFDTTNSHKYLFSDSLILKQLFIKINNEIIKYDYTAIIININNFNIYWYKTKQIKQ